MRKTSVLFVENLKRLRKARGLSQEELAERANIPVPTYIKYEQGKFFPGHKNIDKLCVAAGCSQDEFFFDEKKTVATDLERLKLMISSLSPETVDRLLGMVSHLADLEQKR